ncbi:MAG: hypothetical protein ACYDBV_11545 [Nitrospiria bacterium]
MNILLQFQKEAKDQYSVNEFESWLEERFLGHILPRDFVELDNEFETRICYMMEAQGGLIFR